MNENDKRVMFSSTSDEWATPQAFFNKYNELYSFNTDVCANEGNAKCSHYFTKELDGLQQNWKGVCWCNPVYGEPEYACKPNCKKKKCLKRGYCNDKYKSGIIDWLRKAKEESEKGNVIVCLIPSRTDTRWFHYYVLPFAEVEFIKGRLKFGDSKNSAPFPSMIAIFGVNNINKW